MRMRPESLPFRSGGRVLTVVLLLVLLPSPLALGNAHLLLLIVDLGSSGTAAHRAQAHAYTSQTLSADLESVLHYRCPDKAQSVLILWILMLFGLILKIRALLLWPLRW